MPNDQTLCPLKFFSLQRTFCTPPSFNIFSFSLSYVFSIFTDRFFHCFALACSRNSLNSSMLQRLSMFCAVGASHRLNVLCNVVESLSHVSPAQLIAWTSTRSVNILSAFWTKTLLKWNWNNLKQRLKLSWRTLECRKNKRPEIKSARMKMIEKYSQNSVAAE